MKVHRGNAIAWGGLMFAACLSVSMAKAPLALAAQSEGASAGYLAAAKDLLAKGDLKAAEIQLKNAVREAPNDFDSRFQLGMVYLREGDPNSAEAAFSKLLNSGDHAQQVLPALGEALLMQNKTAEVIQRVEPLDKLDAGTNARIRALRARALLMQGQAAAAKAEVDAAATLAPDLPEILLVQADLLRLQRNYAGAEAIIDKVLSVSPENTLGFIEKAQLRRLASDPEGALKYYDQAIAKRPNDVLTRLGRAAVSVDLKRSDKAQEDISAVLQRDPKQPLALYMKAGMLHDAGKYEEALQVIAPAASRLDDMPGAQALLSELNLRLNHPEQALEHAGRLYAQMPADPGAKRLLALAYARKGEARKIVELLQPVVDKDPDDFRAQMLLGGAYAQLGRNADAAKALEKAVAVDPDNASLRMQLDADRLRAGDHDLAIKDLTELLKADPNDVRAGTMLIAAEAAAGHLREAADLAEKLKSKMAADPLVNTLAGRLHQSLGERDKARAEYQAALKSKADFMPAAEGLASLAQADGRPEEAHAIFEKVLETDENNMAAMLDLARQSAAAGDADAALAWLDRAVAAHPKALQPRLSKVELLLAQNKPQKALAEATLLNDSFPDNVSALNALGRAQLAAGSQGAAVASFQRMAALQPNSSVLQVRLGNLLAKVGRPDDARKAYEAAVKMDPRQSAAWRALVLGDLKGKGLDDALATADRARGTDEALAASLKGAAYAEAGRFDEADGALADAMARRPNNTLLAQRFQVLLRKGDGQGARKLLTTWLQSHPADLAIRSWLAMSLLADKDYPAAIAQHEAILEKAPADVTTLNNLAWLYAKTGNPKALEVARRANDLAPYDPRVNDTLGWILADRGNLREAVGLLTVAHGRAVANGEISYHLAAALAKSGDPIKAAELLKPAITGAPFPDLSDAKELLSQLDSRK